VPADPDAELLRRHRHVSFPLLDPPGPELCGWMCGLVVFPRAQGA
jgi:hypothetical protein